MNLPSEYLKCMESMLKSEFNTFLKHYGNGYFRGIRVNTLKCSVENLKKNLNLKIEESPFSDSSFYIDNKVSGLGNHPLHHAGAFYMQEPSASSAVTILDPEPGEKILDLCAAPGGKSTQIAGKLNQEGLLWSNEIINSRAKILLSNIERLGVRNAVVSNCYPEVLCEKLKGFFDKILVDAPCSGEGMFRKNPDAILEWSLEHVKVCAIRQLSILNTAAKAVKPNGIIVYSTCTFSKEENEGVIYKFLQDNKDFELEEIVTPFGRKSYKNYGTDNALRIFPMDGGEGHFVAKLRRITENDIEVKPYIYKGMCSELENLSQNMLKNVLNEDIYGKIEKKGNFVYILPNNLPDLNGLNVIRAGVLAGEVKKSRIEPAHALFMAAKPENLVNVLNFNHSQKEIACFLRGEEIKVDDKLSGYVGVAVDSVMLGFGKCSGGVLKNKYPKGLRSTYTNILD